MCHAVAATASGPGTPLPAGVLPGTACQASRNASPRIAETQNTRSRSRIIAGASRPPDGERPEVLLGLVRVEDAGPAEREGVLHRAGVGRLLPERAHRVARAGGEEDRSEEHTSELQSR